MKHGPYARRIATYPKNYPADALVEEAVAMAAENWNTGRRAQISSLAGRILQKVRNALRQIGRFFLGEGFTSHEDVFRRVAGGRA